MELPVRRHDAECKWDTYIAVGDANFEYLCCMGFTSSTNEVEGSLSHDWQLGSWLVVLKLKYDVH